MLQQFLSYYQICYKKNMQNYLFLLIYLPVLYTKFYELFSTLLMKLADTCSQNYNIYKYVKYLFFKLKSPHTYYLLYFDRKLML